MGQYLFWEPNRTFRGGSNLLLPLTNLMEAIIFKVVVSLAFLLPALISSLDLGVTPSQAQGSFIFPLCTTKSPQTSFWRLASLLKID